MTMPEPRQNGRRRAPAAGDEAARKDDALMVNSVEKAFRVLSAFGRQHQTLNLSQVASETGMDVSAAQRFTHTLTRLGYLRKDAQTKRFELTAKTLDLGYLTIHAATALAKGELKPGATAFTAGKLGEFRIVGDNLLLGEPFKFTKDNIAQFDF